MVWLEPSDDWQPDAVLDNDRLDLAVARGAAYYGMVRRGEGVKIVASLARTYYIGVESRRPDARRPRPCCPLPRARQRGAGADDRAAERQFDLLVSEPVEFPLYTSSIRLTDRPGELVPVDPEQMTALPPIRTALKTRSRRERGTVPVQLHARLTEIGTLELWCSEVGGERTWRLQFDVRSATQTDVAAHETDAEAAGLRRRGHGRGVPRGAGCDVWPGRQGRSRIRSSSAWSPPPAASGSEWPTSLLRRLWEMLMELEAGRRKSPPHEARWLNLLGYACGPATAWRSMTGGWPKRGRPCRASWPTRPPPAAPSR